ncbi:MAG TPA: RluA family pseudouridine synthase [Planctomycetota bacterium]|nr:RluA family pseudouridine synthase [Planctomycetota bacterium]
MPRLERQYRDLSLPVTELTFTVGLPEEGTRLDVALRHHFPWRSRERFRRMLEEGTVTLNGDVRKASVRLRKGDVVRMRIPVAPDAPVKESGDDLVVLYEDDALVAIDKPAGVVAHPVGRVRHGTLINRLHARYRRTGADADGPDVVPRLAHRLDRDTSGVVLVVKDRRLDAIVTRAFHRREVQKTYLALVHGEPREDSGSIDLALGPAPEAVTKLEMAPREDGLPSRTRWRVRERFGRHALLEVEPLTGRTHQIRVHLRAIGHPIVADHLYGDLRPLRRSCADPKVPEARDAILLDRLALHAHRLALRHPSTGLPLVLESPVPADLARAFAELRALAARRASRAAAS